MYLNIQMSQAVVVHTVDPSTQEAEVEGFLSLKPAQSTKLVPEQPEQTQSWGS